MSDLVLQPGERGLIVGNTGSGKTQMLIAQVRHFARSPVYILDSKEDDGIRNLLREAGDEHGATLSRGLGEFEKFLKLKKKPDYVRIIPPASELNNPDQLDEYMQLVYQKGQSCLFCIDEAYQVHTRGQAGDGIISLLTRGRSKGISLLACTQRPAWLARFFLTESQKFWVYRLQDIQDRKRLAEAIPYPRDLVLDKYSFFYYKSGDASGKTYGPIPLSYDPGYVSEPEISSRWI